MPTTCDEDLLGLATSGTWMKCSSRSTDAFIIYGEPLTRMATFWIFARQRRDFARKSKAEMIPAEVFAAAMRDDGKETADALVWVILYSDPSIRTTWQLHTLTSDWG